MKFSDIPQIPEASYAVDHSWWYLSRAIAEYKEEHGLDVNPDFQRGHVWTQDQKIAFVKWGLRGGTSGMDIFLNHPGWMRGWEGAFVLVDGKQRLQAVEDFLDEKFSVFGLYFSEFEGPRDTVRPRFRVHVLTLKTRREVLEWYIAFNSGGSTHTENEISKVKKLLAKEGPPEA